METQCWRAYRSLDNMIQSSLNLVTTLAQWHNLCLHYIHARSRKKQHYGPPQRLRLQRHSKMHRSLRIPDIQAEIFQYLRHESFIWRAREDRWGQRDLVSLAIVCKAFHEEALNILWAYIPIIALVGCFNSDLVGISKDGKGKQLLVAKQNTTRTIESWLIIYNRLLIEPYAQMIGLTS